MAILPLPERGQPIDVEYLYKVTAAVNALSDQVSRATYRYTTVDTPASGPQSVRTGDARIKGGYKNITVSNATVGQRAPWTYSLGSDFKYTPIVVATPVHKGTGAAPDVKVVITSVTTQSVNGVVIFGQAGRIDLDINVLAIGIPN